MDSCGARVLLILLIWSRVGLAHGCACSSNLKHCANITQIPADFLTAQEICKERGGRLSLHQNAADEVANFLIDNTIGDFWIGSRPPEECSNKNTTVDLNVEMEDACVPHCVSVSGDRTLRVRPCTDKLDGFLCADLEGELCKGNAVVLDNSRCMFAPCEHNCIPLNTGYRCSCKQRFRPNRRDPRRCDFYCATTVCAALCMRGGSVCWCPEGFVRSEQSCEDIDECDSNHDCAHKCINTIGSYECSCFEPFILVNGTQCALLPPRVQEGLYSTPSPDYLTRGALSTPGEYIGLIVFLVVAVFALLMIVRYLRMRKEVVLGNNPPVYDEVQRTVSKGI
ncbi:hypothetical protein DNTS_010804 [Danionella cerebrum]|uniref:Thrombomodulin n=1 Tax=Danionella cerebrum TaxID=2873325 RepID=A0A553RQ68_9TELE|nr:hypothetical protein DNTS_010804 [Danionella translucida]